MKNKPAFPKYIFILGRKWRIKEVPTIIYKDAICDGLCDFDNKIIFLIKGLDPDNKFSTLVHEATHAWLVLCGFDQRMNESEIEVHCQLVAAFVEDIVRSFK
jgi:Zn-dependent peptidase ImmA (M78 family)